MFKASPSYRALLKKVKLKKASQTLINLGVFHSVTQVKIQKICEGQDPRPWSGRCFPLQSLLALSTHIHWQLIIWIWPYFLIYINLYVAILFALSGIPYSQTTPIRHSSSGDIFLPRSGAHPDKSGLRVPKHSPVTAEHYQYVDVSLRKYKQAEGHGPWHGVGSHVFLPKKWANRGDTR